MIDLTSFGRLGGVLRAGIVALMAAASLASMPSVGQAQVQGPQRLAPQTTLPQGPVPQTNASDLRAGELTVPLNKSQVLRLDRAFTDLSVGNPAVADVMALSNRSVYVLGKALGSTNVTVYGPGRQIIAVVDVVVSHDVEGLKSKLFDLLPNERVEVRSANDSVVVSGTVSTPEQLSRATSIAERYAPGKLTNLMRVRGSQQVMLQVRVAEVSRTTARQLGIRPQILSGDFVFQPLDLIDPNAFAAAIGRVIVGDVTITTLLEALEEKGVVKMLAEPNLIALSGDTANFLAGGEFPVPVAQDGDAGRLAITVAFKQFGVSLAFTPTVIDGDLVNLIVSPEVSQIDPNNSVVLNGFKIPGLSTRRASTTVELRDGQSFAIAGLLQSDFQDQVRGVPGINELPVLGALFRSTQFQRKETELVIIVTPRLVKPVASASLAAPTDTFRSPNNLELFLLGQVEGAPAPASTAVGGTTTASADPARAMLGAQAGGGLEGNYGHIIK